MSAWEQWGGKQQKPSSSKLHDAQEALQSLLRASTASSGGLERDSSSAPTTTTSVFQKTWDSARAFTKSAVAVPKDASDALEGGERHQTADDVSVATSLCGRKTATTLSGLALPAMSWNARFKYFVAMTLLGLLFFGMAFVFLPLLVIRPSKFALSFTLGSMCCMSAVAMLKGPAAYAVELLQPHRLLLTCAYFVTLGCTLYSCLVLGDYVFVVLSAVLQLLTLGSFALSAFPSGTSRLRGALLAAHKARVLEAVLLLRVWKRTVVHVVVVWT